jgi:hypothetical protein
LNGDLLCGGGLAGGVGEDKVVREGEEKIKVRALWTVHLFQQLEEVVLSTIFLLVKLELETIVSSEKISLLF